MYKVHYFRFLQAYIGLRLKLAASFRSLTPYTRLHMNRFMHTHCTCTTMYQMHAIDNDYQMLSIAIETKRLLN